ncbi:MAG TPA: HAD family phosphatase [Candidatus Sumerlaeota bacterium]|nr:HAD family phosphatase [Candidatus Sumerlaeota bacterium]
MNSFAVIFDSDGVIVDSEPFSLAAFREAMDIMGVHLSDEDVMANCGLTDPDIVQYVYRKFNRSVDADLFHAHKTRLYEEKVNAGRLEACPGAPGLLEQLTAEMIPYALASSGSSRKIQFNLSRVGLYDKFPVIISGEQVARGKPDPAIFLKAAECLGMAPETCVVVEDSLNGIEAARRAGMKCLAVAGTFPAERLVRADFVVESLEEVTVRALLSIVDSNNTHPKGGICKC